MCVLCRLKVEATLDPYEARRVVDMAVGSSPMGDAAQAMSAVASAAALAGPTQYFCGLCQVGFLPQAIPHLHSMF